MSEATAVTGEPAAASEAPAVETTEAKPQATNGIYEKKPEETAEPAAEASDEGKEAGEPEKQEAKADTGEGDAAAKTDGAPEKYEDFNLPDGMVLDEERTAEFAEAARTLDLSQEQAQTLFDMHNSAVENVTQQFVDQIQDGQRDQEIAWKKEIDADEAVGSKEAQGLAARAVEQFGTPELKKMLEETRLGNHPEMLRIFHKIGQAISEDTLVTGEGRSKADKEAQRSTGWLDPGKNPPATA